MSAEIDRLREFLQQGQEGALASLQQFMAIASVSNAAGFDRQLAEAAALAETLLKSAGLEHVRQHAALAGRPSLVLAADDSAGPDAPLVVIYGHYDVQPEGTGWSITKAFVPHVANGRIWGRGAGDNKGPVVAVIQALRAWKIGIGRLPIRVRIVLEGEEENGSTAVIHYVGTPEAADFLKGATSVLVCDTLASPDGRPSLTFGLRGMAYFRLKVFGPAKEAHSGHVGGVVQDPGEALAHLLASLRDPRTGAFRPDLGSISTLSAAEKELLATSPVDEPSIQRETGGVPAVIKIAGRSLAEQAGAFPSLTVHSLLSGNTEEDSTPTNVPTVATAKFSIRLVPQLYPAGVEAAVRAHLAREVAGPLRGTVRMELQLLKSSFPVRFSPAGPVFTAAGRAMEAAWGQKPAFLLAGGTIPVISPFEKAVGAPIVLWGGTNSDSGFHGPDENLTLANFFGSAEGLARFFLELSIGST